MAEEGLGGGWMWGGWAERDSGGGGEGLGVGGVGSILGG